MSALEDLFIGRNPEGISNSNDEFVSRIEHMIRMGNNVPGVRGNIRIISAYRSYEEQERLYQKYLDGTGNLAAPPGRSNHNHGLAMDLVFDSPAARRWAHANASTFGLAFPIASEDWHIEPAGLRDGTFNSQDWGEDTGHEGHNDEGPEYQSHSADPSAYLPDEDVVDNTKVDTHLMRLNDIMMGGQYNVQKALKITEPGKLMERNQQPEQYQ